MSIPKGTILSGIRCLEDIRLRCRVDRATGCWHWGGAELRRGPDVVEPRAWLPDLGKTVTITKAAVLMAGKDVGAGHRVWNHCRTYCCANPEHCLIGTTAAWGQWVREAGYLRGRPERVAANRRAKINSGHASLTPELVDWIRESQQPTIEIAHALDRKISVVSRARTGRTYAPVYAASVFSFAKQLAR